MLAAKNRLRKLRQVYRLCRLGRNREKFPYA